jgi:C1A family cysteine protease
MTPVKNQGNLGSCVGFALAGMLEIVPVAISVMQDESERFIWYNSKNNDGLGNPNSDRGTWIPVAIGTAQTLGSCWEIRCPYSNPLATPSPTAYTQAQNMKVTNAYRLAGTTLNDYKAMLSIGWPVIVGFDIFGDINYQRRYIFSDYTNSTGIMLMPPAPVPGRTNGHAVVFVGYDDNTRLMKFKNSWGTGLGDRGYYYMPYDYLKWTHDAWVLWGQRIQLPVSVSGVSASADGAAATTDAEKFRISEGKQPSETRESLAPISR